MVRMWAHHHSTAGRINIHGIDTVRRNPWDEGGQLILAGGVALAFALLMIAGLTQIGTEMDADRDVEPSLGPEFVHLQDQFEKAVSYHYNTTNDSAEESFRVSADLFVHMEFHYGVVLEFDLVNVTGTPGNETVDYGMRMRSSEQQLFTEGTAVLKR